MHRTAAGLALAIGLAATSIVTASAQQYGYNYGPPGSYQQSCVNIQMRGSTLSASCTSNSGQRVYSSLNVNGCNGDIANINGHLGCNGNYGYNNNGYGYGYSNGSGRNDDDDNDGDSDNGHGHGHHHHHPNGNAYGYYGNGNGSGNGYGYNNGGYGGYGGYGYGLPQGSYQQSCTNDRMNGSILSASCTSTNGAQVYSSIDVRRCQSRGTDIANRNGYLSC